MRVYVHIPQGYSSETKAIYLNDLQAICREIFSEMVYCYISEYRPEHLCETAKGGIFALVYSARKDSSLYRKVGQAVEELGKKCFGNEKRTAMVFREQIEGNIYINGIRAD